MAELRAICSGCGHPRDETTALDDTGERPLYEYDAGSTVCQACEARAQLEDRIRKDDPTALRGRIFYTTRLGGDQ